MQKTTPSRGFAHLGLIIAIVVVVAAIAVGGWYVWDKNKDDKNGNGSNNSQNNQNEEPSDPSEGGKYLVIKEWGVRIPLGKAVTEAYYTFSSDNLGEFVSLYDAAFDKTENANGVSCGGDNRYRFYVISRATPENVASMEEGAGPEFKKFPFTDKYLFGGLGAHQAPPYCANLNPDPYGQYQEDQTIIEVANDKEKAFNDAFNGLELSQ